MKIRFKRGDVILEYEKGPMSPERFAATYRLVELAIGGAVLLGAIRMVGIWAIVWAVGALAAVGLYKLFQKI